MDRARREAVFTRFIKPFLSRNDSSDPGCVSSIRDSSEWLQANFGGFSGFATLQELQAINSNFTSGIRLSALTPAQVVELTLSSGALNDTNYMERVIQRLEEGNALENMDEFLTQLTAKGEILNLQPAVRDLVMNGTFSIISSHFSSFGTEQWLHWFNVILVPVLPSFSPFMLQTAIANISCTNYHVVVSGMASVFPEIQLNWRQEIANVLLSYLRDSITHSKPACRQRNQSDAEWLEANVGPFSQYATYYELKVFNISGLAIVDFLSPNQRAELILDTNSSVLEDEAFVRKVLTNLTESPHNKQLSQFFETFSNIMQQRNITFISNAAVRETILNVTLSNLHPYFEFFAPEDFKLWFQVYLFTALASFRPDSLVVIPLNISCASYEAILTGFQQSVQSLPRYLSQDVRSSMESLEETFSRCPSPIQCKETPVDENLICAEVNRSQLQQTLSMDTPSEALCNFSITQYACSSATNLTASNLVTLLICSVERQQIYPVEVWKLFFQKASTAVNQALVSFATMAPNNSNPSLSQALEALGEVRIASFDQTQLQNETFVSSWFQTLRPFLASPSPNFLLCLSSKNFSCQTYQIVIQAFSSQTPLMDRARREAVFTRFIKPFLSRNDSSGRSCVEAGNDDRQWLQDNFGKFYVLASYKDFVTLKNNFNGVDIADLLTVTQLAELGAAPSQLKTKQEVKKIMTVINPNDFGAFFDIVSPAIEAHPTNYTEEVKFAFLQEVFDRGNLSSPAISDTEFLLWLRVRLSPLLVNLSSSLVAPLFDIVKERSCNSSQEMITLLDTLHMTFSINTQGEIFKNIFFLLQGPTPLKCYSGGSFYIYLKNTFRSFGFPDLSMFTSLLPKTRESELLNTISPSELQRFLSQPNVIGNNSDICVIFDLYKNTPAFLETENVPDDVKKVILPCVWPLALSSHNKYEVDLWFNVRLRNYSQLLSKSLISFTKVQNASCLAFQAMVSIMGNNFTYSGSDFGPGDVYTTIRTYLMTDSGARCYSESDAGLQSTSWFVSYIGKFVTFITLDDLTTFISMIQNKTILEDQANLQLFNNAAIPNNVTDYYISQLFAFNPTFNPIKLPGFLICSPEIPSQIYSSVTEADAILILNKTKTFCNGTKNPQVSTLLPTFLYAMEKSPHLTLV